MSVIERGCISPLLLPEKELSQLEVEGYWGADRNSLRICKQISKDKTDWYEQLRKDYNGARRSSNKRDHTTSSR
jgi:hypothetical protein